MSIIKVIAIHVVVCFFITSTGARPVKITEESVKAKHRSMVLSNQQFLQNDIHDLITVMNSNIVKGDVSGIPTSAPQTFTEGHCLACTVIIKYGISLLNNSEEAEKGLEWLTETCVLFGLETPRVCNGGVGIFGEEAISVLKRVSLSPEEICGLTFPEQCPLKKIDSLSKGWKIEIPKDTKIHKQQKIKSEGIRHGHKILKVLHISDVHIDMQYIPGSDAVCNEPLCCREKAEVHDRMSKIFGNWTRKAYEIAAEFTPKGKDFHKTETAGKWGDYRQCDLPTRTLDHLLQTVASGSINDRFDRQKNSEIHERRNIDYILWTGDIPAHDVWAQSKETQSFALKYMTSILLKYFPNTKVYPAVGNHDSFPSNYLPSSEYGLTGNKSAKWFYDALADAWSPWLPEDALKTVRLGAYYTVIVKPGCRIVSLNTNFCYTENWWILMNPEDPGGMLKWFVEILLRAEDEGEKVHVIGHVPPGREPDCLEQWSQNYYRIIERFKDTISAQFFGHTHFDEFQIFYSSEARDTPVSVAYLAPSVTPYIDMNPAFRIYDVESFGSNTSWEVLNHRTYILNLEEANKSGFSRWDLEYDASSAFNISALTAGEWGKVVSDWRDYFLNETLQHNVKPPQTLVNYVRFYSKGRLKQGEDKKSDLMENNANAPCERMGCARSIVCNIMKNVQWEMCLGGNDKTV